MWNQLGWSVKILYVTKVHHVHMRKKWTRFYGMINSICNDLCLKQCTSRQWISLRFEPQVEDLRYGEIHITSCTGNDNPGRLDRVFRRIPWVISRA